MNTQGLEIINTGRRYGRWTVLKELEPKIYTKGRKTVARIIEVKCDCGNVEKVYLGSLRSGRSRSCGCLSREQKHLNKKIIYGKGINDSNGIIIKNKEIDKCYLVWRSMIARCYSKVSQDKQPAYRGCSVCDEWLYFTNFKRWFDNNYKKDYMQGWHLDKDILIKGNKVYSPQTCAFVPKDINMILTKNKSRRGVLPLGVLYEKRNRKYVSLLSIKSKQRYLGAYKNIMDAFNAYKQAKEAYIKEVADEWKDRIAPNVYEAMCNYKVEITD